MEKKHFTEESSMAKEQLREQLARLQVALQVSTLVCNEESMSAVMKV